VARIGAKSHSEQNCRTVLSISSKIVLGYVFLEHFSRMLAMAKVLGSIFLYFPSSFVSQSKFFYCFLFLNIRLSAPPPKNVAPNIEPRNFIRNVGIEVLTAVTMRNTVFWVYCPVIRSQTSTSAAGLALLFDPEDGHDIFLRNVGLSMN
jgi:hypothetical protein